LYTLSFANGRIIIKFLQIIIQTTVIIIRRRAKWNICQFTQLIIAIPGFTQ